MTVERGVTDGAIGGGAVLARGVTRKTTIREDHGSFTIATEQDCSAIVERNRRLQNSHDGYTPSRELRWAASIPNIFLEQWMKETGVNCSSREFWPIIRKKLNDPEFRHFRTSLWNL